jgi:hypothetical protein
MKKRLIGCLLCIGLVSLPCPATFGALNSITIDPILAAYGIYSWDYERSITERWAMHWGYSSFGYHDNAPGAKLTGSILLMGSRQYFGSAQSSVYFGADVRNLNLAIYGTDRFMKWVTTGSLTDLALTLGYKRITTSRVTYDCGATYLYDSGAKSGVLPYFRIGWSW